MADLSQCTLRFVDYEPVDEALDDRMRRIASDSDKIPEAAMHLDVASGVLTIDCKKVPAWNGSGASRLRTVRVGKTFVVRPPWISEPVADHERLIVIDPAGAFGSGLHETTQLCLQAIEGHLPQGTRVLEVGTGSGVLSIAAALCGAATVQAVDVDPTAVESAKANVLRNAMQSRIQVSLSEGPPWLVGQVDVLIANITYDTLMNLRDSLGVALRPGGLLIVSGVSPRFWNDFVLAMSSSGFEPIEQLNQSPWSALVAKWRTS